MKTNIEINTDFLKEWKPFDKLNKKVERALLTHFIGNKLMKHPYILQPTHEERSKKIFNIYTFSQIDEILGLAYTSSGDYAGLWVCNGGYLWADPTHYFIGFAINKDGKVIGIAHDFEETEIFIEL